MLGKPRRIRRKASKLRFKQRIAKIPASLLKKTDAAYSLKIRKRDKHCQYPNCTSTKGLQNSHYHGRAIKSTRFDDDNCIALCYWHHFASKLLGFEYQKQRKEVHGYDGQYTLFMRSRLGSKRFAALDRRAKKKLKLTREYLTDLLTSLTT